MQLSGYGTGLAKLSQIIILQLANPAGFYQIIPQSHGIEKRGIWSTVIITTSFLLYRDAMIRMARSASYSLVICMTNTDTFFSWVRVRRSVTGISSTIELCSTLLILKVCYNVRIFCTFICLQTCQSLFWTQSNSQSSIYKKNTHNFWKDSRDGDRSRDLSDHPIQRQPCY